MFLREPKTKGKILGEGVKGTKDRPKANTWTPPLSWPSTASTAQSPPALPKASLPRAASSCGPAAAPSSTPIAHIGAFVFRGRKMVVFLVAVGQK